MPKTFEDEFTKSQIDMVSICFEYAKQNLMRILFRKAGVVHIKNSMPCFRKRNAIGWMRMRII